MPEPQHDEALVNTYLERVSALSVSAFDGADVGKELAQIMCEAVMRCGSGDGGSLAVLAQRLRDRADAAEREGQPQVRDTFAKAASMAMAKA